MNTTTQKRITKATITKVGFGPAILEFEINSKGLIVKQSCENGNLLQPIPLTFYICNTSYVNLFKVNTLLENSMPLSVEFKSTDEFDASYQLIIPPEKLIPFLEDKKNHTVLLLKHDENYPPIVLDLLSIEVEEETNVKFALFLARYPIRKKNSSVFFFSDMVEDDKLHKVYQPIVFFASNFMTDDRVKTTLYEQWHISQGLNFVRNSRNNGTLDDYARQHNISFS